jgi:transglutaminase-like putative cysteine protease
MNPRLRVTVFAALATILGSLSLLPVFSSMGWIPRVVLMVLAIAATSAALQRIRVVTAVIPLAMIAVWAFLVTALYAHSVAPLGFIPGPAALRLLHTTMSSGFTDTVQLSSPVDVTRGLSLLTTAGVGLVAVVVETLASGLRRPAVAGLPLLAIFTVSAATLSGGVGWRPFVFAAAGYLALLLAEGRDRVGRWGRPVRAIRGSVVRGQAATSQLTQVGRRVGFAAISIAVVLPVIVPGLHSGWFGTHHTNGVGGFSSDNGGAATISPIVSIRQELNEPTPTSLFTYTTTGTPTYLRLLTLDSFDGTVWSVSSVTSPDDTKISNGIPPPAGVTLHPTGTATTNVVITGLRQAYLPAPSTVTAVTAHGDWRYNPVNPAIYGINTATPHQSYSVTSAVYQPTSTMLNSLPAVDPDASLEADLEMPTNLPVQVRTVADQIIAAAHAVTPYQKALALQAWFQAGTYDITIKTGTDENALITFLNDRRGYCEQFAATMALMARLEGIPARVDVGFTPGSPVGTTKTYLVTTADAHAWPELYFPDAGWLRFEPTPRSDGQTTTPGYAPLSTGPQPATSVSPGANGAHAPLDIQGLAKPSVGTIHKNGKSLPVLRKLPVGWLLLLVIVIVGIAVAPLARWVTRRRRWTSADTEAARAHAAWAELGDDLRDLGLDWRGQTDTPRRAAATLVATRRLATDVAAEQALSRLTRAEELARYAARPDELRWVDQDPRADESTVRKALFGSVSRGRRLRARLAPSSSSRIAVSATAWVSDSWRGFTLGVRRWVTGRLPGGGRDDLQD